MFGPAENLCRCARLYPVRNVAACRHFTDLARQVNDDTYSLAKVARECHVRRDSTLAVNPKGKMCSLILCRVDEADVVLLTYPRTDACYAVPIRFAPEAFSNGAFPSNARWTDDSSPSVRY